MGFEKIVQPPHVCLTPWMPLVWLQRLGVGTQWRCDACRQLWVLVGDRPDNPTKWEQVPDSLEQVVKDVVAVAERVMRPILRCPLCHRPNGGISHRQAGVWECAGPK
jgi:ribosomal protein L37AE/L43A